MDASKNPVAKLLFYQVKEASDNLIMADCPSADVGASWPAQDVRNSHLKL
jgi:hypothetical protein